MCEKRICFGIYREQKKENDYKTRQDWKMKKKKKEWQPDAMTHLPKKEKPSKTNSSYFVFINIEKHFWETKNFIISMAPSYEPPHNSIKLRHVKYQ